jgi:tetratricopeptide (TPR) repeat protein
MISRLHTLSLVLALLFLISPALLAQGATPLQSAAASAASAAAAASPDYSQEAWVIEKLENSYAFNADGTSDRESHVRLRVQSDAGVQQFGQLVIGYNRDIDVVEIKRIRVTKPSGQQIDTPTTDVQDLSSAVERVAPMFSDYREKHISVAALRPGDVLEYEIAVRTTKPLVPGQFWAEHNFQKEGVVLDESLQISVPANKAIKLKSTTIQPKVTEQQGRKLYTWTTSHRDPSQSADEIAKKQKDKTDADAKDDFPDVQLSTFQSWDEVGRWYNGLQHDRVQPDDTIRKKVAELTANAKTDEEKARVLYSYVARNVRYVSISLGIGRFQPHAADDVLANQYGDCKDKHTLLAAMLAAAGIHSDPVLIHHARKLDPDVPSPAQFDHLITAVQLNGKQVWLDSTTEVAPFAFLAQSIRDKQALLVSDKPLLVTTPAATPFQMEQKTTIRASLNSVGALDAHVELAMRGDSELGLRLAFRQVPEPKWPDLMNALANALGFGGSVTDTKVSDPSNPDVPFTLSFHAVRQNYYEWAKKNTEVALPMPRIELTDADDSHPNRPLKLGTVENQIADLRLEFPPGSKVNVPIPVDLVRDYADYHASYKLEGNVLTAHRGLHVKQTEVAPANIPSYAAFRRAISGDLDQIASLERSAPESPALAKDLTADDLNAAGTNALRQNNFRMAADLLKAAVEKDPKHKFAWNNLGLAYLDMQEYDDAIAAFHKQIEINPYDEYSYNNLGRALQAQGKRKEAEAAFRKQLDVNPLDRWAHSSLANLFVEEKRWTDALPEIQAAVSRDPNDPNLQAVLGQVDLNLGKDDDGLAALDKAVQASPNPLTWNNVAYILCEQRKHLDRALQYADSAVEQINSELRNVSLASIDLRQIGLVNLLGHTWDTVGWIYFEDGKYEQAEKFLRAAWDLQQDTLIGDHLGQLYEKLGRKNEAVEMYAEALAAPRAEAETRTRLAALVGESKVDALVKAAAPKLTQARTVRVGEAPVEPKPVNKNGDGHSGSGQTAPSGTADFLVSFAGPDKIDEVKFISGSEALKGLAPKLQNAPFHPVFPDSSPTKLIRRATVTCAATGCDAKLMTADAVSSVD